MVWEVNALINAPACMRNSYVKCLVVTALCATSASSSYATGMYSVPQWLEQGGVAADHSPEFYWDIEMKQLAAQFKPTQKRVLPAKKPAADANSQPETESFSDQASQADMADFEAAIKQGEIKPADPTQATRQHKAARDAIAVATESTATPLPEEQPSEFADYHKGAFAFHLGQKHYDEAATAWGALLKQPAEQRHYRSVWAAFMLGKLAVFEKKPEAVKWFHTARQLAKEGFADSLGLAADSYGWEAKSELDQDHLEKAAQLYLTQLSLGDDSAIVSLKVLVPDRMPIEGTMNFGPVPPEGADQAALKKFEAESMASAGAALLRAARDPLLRRIVTAHVLATETVSDSWLESDNGSGIDTKPGERCKRWLAAVEKAGVSNVDDADQLGWTAYTAGNYTEAERWLKLCSGESSIALWLKSKLLRRTGKTEEAAKAMAQAWKLILAEPPIPEPTSDEPQFTNWTPGLKPLQSAGGDLGSLRLQRGDFINAFDAFYTGGMHEDTAYMADHVLTADELKAYVDEHVKWTAANEKASAEEPEAGFHRDGLDGSVLRWLLARRLVREDRYSEARSYFPSKYREVLDHYTTALNDAANEKLLKPRRARAWFNAAVIARESGMELMGTEGAPDGFMSGGSFEANNIADERETGTTFETKYVDDKEVKAIKAVRFSVPVTGEEKKRLAANRPAPNKRFHYRYVAAALGWKAAALLPDQSDELADVLNTSGGWIRNDDKAADKFFQAIEHRAAKTKLGREAGAKHWFVEHIGPWSANPKE